MKLGTFHTIVVEKLFSRYNALQSDKNCIFKIKTVSFTNRILSFNSRENNAKSTIKSLFLLLFLCRYTKQSDFNSNPIFIIFMTSIVDLAQRIVHGAFGVSLNESYIDSIRL